MEQIETLKQQARAVAEKIGRIEDAERYAQNKKLEGKAFKYRNSYSCPDKPSDYWWMYTKVLKVTRDFIHIHQFQTDRYGSVTIDLEKKHYRHFHGGFVEIKSSEFERQWKALKARIGAA